jgi:hypothetical protein
MGLRHRRLVLAAVTAAGCAPRDAAPDLTPAHAAAIEDSVRTFAQAVAPDVSREGPIAWRRHFAESPAFFMASEGRLAFPNSETATRVIHDLARVIPHIELRWGDGLRVDPLAPGLAEHRTGPWRLRNAHWSVAGPPPLVR